MSIILMGPGIVGRAMYFNGASGAYHLPSGLGNGGSSGAFNGGGSLENYYQLANAANVTSLYGRDAWATKGAQQYFMCSTVASPTVNKFLAGGPAGATRLNVYSGGRPSISNMTSLNDYSSNLLVSFSIPAWSSTRSNSGYYIDPSPACTINALSNTVEYTGTTIYMGMCPTFTSASASGTATWFWFGNYSSPTNLSGISFVTGSVGKTGSGSDLEMADTSIISGSLYKSLGFKFHIPVVQSSD